MTPIDLTKSILNVLVGVGTAKIVKSIIENNTSTHTLIAKVTVTSAAVVIGLMASDATQAYSDQKIDEIVAWWRENVTTT
jgi:hypothetical protein